MLLRNKHEGRVNESFCSFMLPSVVFPFLFDSCFVVAQHVVANGPSCAVYKKGESSVHCLVES